MLLEVAAIVRHQSHSSFDREFLHQVTCFGLLAIIRISDLAVCCVAAAAGYNAPVAVDDYFAAFLDMENSFTVLTNDYDKDGNALTITSLPNEPTNGMAVISADGKKILYKPFGLGLGLDYLTYEITDSTGLTARAKVVITPRKNNAPSLRPDVITVFGDTPVTFNIADLLLNDQDVDVGDKMSKPALMTADMRGTLSVVQGLTFKYTPKKGWFGDDVVPYSVTDTPGATSKSSLTFWVVPDPCMNNLCAPFNNAGNCSQKAEACVCSPGSGLVSVRVPAPGGNGTVLACRYGGLAPLGAFSLTRMNEAARSSRVVVSFRVGAGGGGGTCPAGDRGRVVKSSQGVQLVSRACPVVGGAAVAAAEKLPVAPRRGGAANSEKCVDGVVTYVVAMPRQTGCYDMTINLTDKSVYKALVKVA